MSVFGEIDGFMFAPFHKRSLKEQVSPHKISVTILIHEYCILKKPTCHLPPGTKSTAKEVHMTEKEKRNFMITIIDLMQASDLTLKELCVRIGNKLNPELYTMFLNRLQDFMEEGLAAVKDFFVKLSIVLKPDACNEYPVITRTSVLGLYLRRMILAFEKLSFCQVSDLHRKCMLYYEAGTTVNGFEESQDFGGSMTDSLMSLSGVRFCRVLERSVDPLSLTDDRKPSEDAGRFNSQRQAEFFILQQVFLLQQNQAEALSPSELQDKIMDMLKANPDIAEAHFLSFLNSLRVKEYCTALHNLFHYFDRKMTFTFDPHSQGQGQSKAKEEEVHRRYAALNLAALHYRFGHREASLAALREAIGMAQDANDNVCLQHALGWLHRLSDQGTARTENLLERAVTKSLELNLPSLTSIGIQAFARHNAVAAAKPCQVFEYLQKSDVLNCQHSQSGFMCTSFANKAALWHMYGKRECTAMMSQLILHLDTSGNGVYYNGESICIALCNLARLHADCGQYGLSMDLINCAKKRFPKNQPNCEIWMRYEQDILFDRSILTRKFPVAESAVLNLKAMDMNEAELREAILNKEKGDFTIALDQLHRLLDKCNLDRKDSNLTADFRCRVLMVLGELYGQTGNPTNGTTYILDCITTAKTHHLEHMSALGCMHLAHLQMKLPEQGLAILAQQQLPILSHGTVYDQGRLYSCWSKCQVARSNKFDSFCKEKERLSAACQLSQAVHMFETVEAHVRVKDTLYLQAALFNDVNMKLERNEKSRRFKLLESQYPFLSKAAINVL